MRLHGDQVDDAAEALGEPDGKLQGDGFRLQGLLDVVQRAQERGAFLVQLVHAGEQGQGALRRHFPVRFRLVFDTRDGGYEQEPSLAHRHRPIGVGEEVGEAGRIEQVQQCPLVLRVGDVCRHREISLRLLRIDVQMAGGPVLGSPRRRVMAQQRFREARLSRTVVCDDCDIADRLRIKHALVSPDAALKRERLDQPGALVEEGRCASSRSVP